MNKKIEKMKKTKEDKEDDILSRKNVVSVGIGKKIKGGKELDEDSIVVGVKKKVPVSELRDPDIIPEEIDGNKTDVIEVGEIEAPPADTPRGTLHSIKNKIKNFLPFKSDRTKRYRPVPIGVSAGHEDITAGTTSFIATNEKGNKVCLSNNHVYANCNKGKEGDAILQPGSIDGGTIKDDKVGKLKGYIKLENSSKVDLAWMEPINKVSSNVIDIDKEIGNLDTVEVGDKVIKSGRTTGVTEGKVLQKHASARVNYGELGIIKLKDQIITEDMSDGGDSGSSVFKEDENYLYPVGLLFAGSDRITIMNDIHNIDGKYGITIQTNGVEPDNNGSTSWFIKIWYALISLIKRWFN